MRKCLQIALMVSPVIATFFSLAPSLWAGDGGPTRATITATVDESGRKIFTNDEYVPASQVTSAPRASLPAGGRNQLVFWSVTDHRWKPVPSAKMGAARS